MSIAWSSNLLKLAYKSKTILSPNYWFRCGLSISLPVAYEGCDGAGFACRVVVLAATPSTKIVSVLKSAML